MLVSRSVLDTSRWLSIQSYCASLGLVFLLPGCSVILLLTTITDLSGYKTFLFSNTECSNEIVCDAQGAVRQL